jgi:hypothetical protein
LLKKRLAWLRPILGSNKRKDKNREHQELVFSAETSLWIFRINYHTDMYGVDIHVTANDTI